jgi:predicted transcriptional regulator
MIKETKNVKIGLSTEAQVNLEFIEAWHKAEKDEITIPEERLYFLDPATFSRILSTQKISLMKILRIHGASSIRGLSRMLKRDYKNVYQDVQLLKQAGLIFQDKTKKIYVPWDKIKAEISLAV